jgi:hypothetical protein
VSEDDVYDAWEDLVARAHAAQLDHDRRMRELLTPEALALFDAAEEEVDRRVLYGDEPDDGSRWLKLDPETYRGGGVMRRRPPRP